LLDWFAEFLLYLVPFFKKRAGNSAKSLLIPQLFVEIPQESFCIPQDWHLIPRLFVEIPQHGNQWRPTEPQLK
jgi:hypothetical protein